MKKERGHNPVSTNPGQYTIEQRDSLWVALDWLGHIAFGSHDLGVVSRLIDEARMSNILIWVEED